MLGGAPTFAVYGPSFVAGLAGIAYFNVFNRTQRVRVIPREHLGKVMGPFYLVNLASYPIAGILVAVLGGKIGPQRLIAVLAALLTLFGAILLTLTVRSFRRSLVALDRVPVGDSV